MLARFQVPPARWVSRLGAKLNSGRTVRATPTTLFAFVFLLALAACVFAADLLAPYDPAEQSLASRLEPPMTPGTEGAIHLLGTDALGRDVFSRMIYGARASVIVATIAAVVSAFVGISIGLIAGYFRGRIEGVAMRLVDLMLGFPTLILALSVLFLVGPSLPALVAVLAFARWNSYARVTRGLVVGLRDEPYILAAKCLGRRSNQIIRRHVLPNIRGPLAVLFTVEIAYLILAEASLSFLGLGIQPPGASWGLIVADGRAYMSTAWWLILFPGIAILFTTLSFNALAPARSEYATRQA